MRVGVRVRVRVRVRVSAHEEQQVERRGDAPRDGVGLR